MRLLLTLLPATLLAACASLPPPTPAPRPVASAPAASPGPVATATPAPAAVPAKDSTPGSPSAAPPAGATEASLTDVAASKPAYGTAAFNALQDTPPAGPPPDVSNIPDAVPEVEPLSKYGNTSPYTVLGEAYTILPTARGFSQTGIASWYGTKFHGMKTSSGERFDMYGMTAAHRNLPLPTYVRVTNLGNGRSVIVKVNDRGPFHTNRVMDLSYAAALKLDVVRSGTAKVRIEALDPAEFQPALDASGKPLPAAPAPTDSDPIGEFFVQVGAFSKLDNATALEGRLLDMVYAPINITDGDKPDAIHRVQIGPFYTRVDAEKMIDIIRAHDLGDPRIVSSATTP